MLSRSCSSSGRELPFLRLQMGLKSLSLFPFLPGKKKNNQIPSAQCALQKTIPSKFKIIPKGVMRLRNQIPQLCRANICRLHKHRVYSTEHNAANDGLLFFWVFCWFFFNVHIQGNVKITPLYNPSPLVMSPI